MYKNSPSPDDRCTELTSIMTTIDQDRTYSPKLAANDDPNATQDVFREQLMWTTGVEELMRNWYKKSLVSADVHHTKARKFSALYILLGIPASVLPLSMGALANAGVPTWLETAMMFTTGVLVTTQNYINPGKRGEKHYTFEARYHELAIQIAAELVKPQRHRLEADVFLQKIMDKYNFLNGTAPV